MPAGQCITRQSKHFPTSFLDGESVADHYQRLSEQLYLFADPLLAAFVGYSSVIEGLAIEGAANTKRSVGHLLLTLLVRRALGLFRLPYHEDRAFANGLGRDVEVGFRALKKLLTIDRIDAMTEEVAKLYQHTQDRLASAGLSTVRLHRRLSPPERQDYLYQQNEPHTLYGLVHASRRTGRTHIELDMDTLNSFGDDGGYSNRPITLTLDIPAADVLYCVNLVGWLKDGCIEPAVLESGEWMVINRSIDGIVKVPLAAVEIREDDLTPHEFFDDLSYCEDFLRRYSPAPLRWSAPNDVMPCIRSSFSERTWSRFRRAVTGLVFGQQT